MSAMSLIQDHAWIPITLAAALFQCIRTALQKRMTAQLSANANTLARYAFGLPFVFIYLGLVAAVNDAPLPALNTAFVINTVIGGAAQIIATSLLILAFTTRSYAVATALSKTEAVQAAIFGVIILGETMTAGGVVALLTILTGVIAMSAPPGDRWAFKLDRAAVYGLLSGTMFGVTAISIRGANLALDAPFIPAAAVTLASMVLLQGISLAVYLAWREMPQLQALFQSWKPALLVGLFSALGSIGWFTGMALEKAAYVRTLGQVELVFTVLASRFYFREALKPREKMGIGLIGGGILILLWAA